MSNSNDKIKIKVEPRYIQERSEPIRSIYFFSYHVTILNQGQQTAQLMTRYWQVHGPGVVGNNHILHQEIRSSIPAFVRYTHLLVLCTAHFRCEGTMVPILNHP